MARFDHIQRTKYRVWVRNGKTVYFRPVQRGPDKGKYEIITKEHYERLFAAEGRRRLKRTPAKVKKAVKKAHKAKREKLYAQRRAHGISTILSIQCIKVRDDGHTLDERTQAHEG